MSGPAPGYRRYIEQGVPIGIVVPGPKAWRTLYSGTGDYLASCARMEQQALIITEQPKAMPILVPMMDPKPFLRWAEQEHLDPLDPNSRARWGAQWLLDRVIEDDGMPIVRGAFPISKPGDLICMGLMLACGVNGESIVMPPAPYEAVTQMLRRHDVRARIVARVDNRRTYLRTHIYMRDDGMPSGLRGDLDWPATVAMLIAAKRDAHSWVRIDGVNEHREWGKRPAKIPPKELLLNAHGIELGILKTAHRS